MFCWPSLLVAEEPSFSPTRALAMASGGHGCQRESSEAYADPTGLGPLPGEEAPYRLEADVGRYEVEAYADELLGPLLGGLRRGARGGEPPEEDDPRQRFNERVGPETHERDGPRNHPRADRDRRLHTVPAHPEPGQELRPPDKPFP